jgi:probable phosphoglycerate mutase
VKLYLVRHGQSTGNVSGVLMGQSDHPLTELGERQARAAAARLAPCGPMPIRCSDLPRARATAEAIAAVWTASASVVLDARLREIDLGYYEGRSWEEFAADEALTAAFADDPYGTALPDGESLEHLQARVLTAVRDVLAAHGLSDASAVSTDAVASADASATASGMLAAEEGEAACIVAHDGPIRAILNHYLGVPPQKWWTLSTTHGGVSLLEFSGDWVNVRYVNATGHLAGLGDTVYVPSDDG